MIKIRYLPGNTSLIEQLKVGFCLEEIMENKAINNFLNKFTCEEDREQLKDVLEGADKPKGVAVMCLRCPSKFFIVQEYKKKEVTCPQCSLKLNIRSYKNGTVNISRTK